MMVQFYKTGFSNLFKPLRLGLFNTGGLELGSRAISRADLSQSARLGHGIQTIIANKFWEETCAKGGVFEQSTESVWSLPFYFFI